MDCAACPGAERLPLIRLNAQNTADMLSPFACVQTAFDSARQPRRGRPGMGASAVSADSR